MANLDPQMLDCCASFLLGIFVGAAGLTFVILLLKE